MPLPAFKDEAEFRTKWIAPFLSKLGYIQVSHIHGSGEQGKDFFFADFDKFEHRRFYAVQAKNGNIGAGTREMDGLLNQVQRSFTVRLRFFKEAHERRVSAVYIMASGTISREAREYISDWCHSHGFGENVYFLDGETLERLDKFAFQRADLDLRNKLIALLHECQVNLNLTAHFQENFKAKQKPIVSCRTLAIDQLLMSPPPDELLPVIRLFESWEMLTRLNTIGMWNGGIAITYTDESWKSFEGLAEKTRNLTLELQALTFQSISKLDSRYSLSVEVVEPGV